jgi:hypothetical protein
MLKGLSIPVWVSWFTITFANGDKEKRFVVSKAAIAGSRLARLGRSRWKIEAFFKTIKHNFALRKAAQGTRLGMLVSCYFRCSPSYWRSLQALRHCRARLWPGVTRLSRRRAHSCC